MIHGPAYGGADGTGVPLGNEEACFSWMDDLADAADICCDDRHSVGEGLHDDIGDAIPITVLVDDTRHDHHVVRFHETHEMVMRDKSGQIDIVFKPEAVNLRYNAVVPVAIAHECEMNRKFFPAQPRHGCNQIGKAFFAAKTAHSQNSVRGQTGGGTVNVLNEGQVIVNEVDFAFASGRAEFLQPFHVGSVIGADKQRVAGLLREQPVLRVNISGPSSEGKGYPSEPGGHPGCRRGPVCPRRVQEADTVIRDEFGEPETGKETERVFRVRLGVAHALQQYFPD